jgi:hypothetical protein
LRLLSFSDERVHGRPVNGFDSELGGCLLAVSCLGNTELFNQLSTADNGALEPSTVCSGLIQKSATGVPIDDAVESAASHFYEIGMSRLKHFEISPKSFRSLTDFGEREVTARGERRFDSALR